MSTSAPQDDHLRWQREVWDTMASTYETSVANRFVPCTLGCLERMELQPGQRVLDLGCGPGGIAIRAARTVGPAGQVTAIDISEPMLALVRSHARNSNLKNVTTIEGRAERIPASDGSHDVLVASLCLMFVHDKAAAAREIARVLAPGGRMVAAVWAGLERCDVARFQRTIGSFAPEPPVKGVGPASLANPTPFLETLAAHGLDARVEEGECNWSHSSLQEAWDSFALVTALRMSEQQIASAKAAVIRNMWPNPDSPREFRNTVLYLVGTRGKR